MFRRLLLRIIQLWDVLCEALSSSTTSQTPSSSPSDSMPSTNVSQAPRSTVSNALASTSFQAPSSSDSYSTCWDVFLSFRGSDTRNKFTSHLYDKLDTSGIRTFKDDPELRRGDVISTALLDAIRKSKTYIVVLSENYASSSWCLDELAEILNCCRTMQRLVIPVFYNVDPAVVRYQIGSFREAFEKHLVRFEMEKANNWRLALTEVASFSGYHVSVYRSEADVINEIVDELLLKFDPKTLYVTKYPVGLSSRVKSITTLLSGNTNGVIKFGIYGMGGVGKTTLAKALYNELLGGRSYKGSCFLANVREISGTAKGLVTLQQQLINDVLNSTTKVEVHNVDQGIKLIEARICSTKVVVVIDDLNDLKQFQSLVGPFASGSLVIITTRDEEMLDKTEVETRYRYMVNTLDDDDSLALLTKHAFGNGKPNDTLKKLSKDILCLAGGLPLALEVFGSHLYTQSEIGWKYYIEKLQRNPNSTIRERLVISFEALESEDPMLKKIFVDIACLFIGRKKQEVVHIMESYYSYANHLIDMLRKKCLLTISNDLLGMHDLLQDVGKEIAYNNSLDEPGKHSRLWVLEDIYDVLKNHNGTEAIECIIYGDREYALDDGGTFTTDTFKSMSKLRFLYLQELNLTGSFEHIFKDLRWLRWDSCPLKCLPSEFYPQKLGILELLHSNIAMWEQNMVSHVFGNLKFVNMLGSKDLTTTPNFTKLPCLETLNLGYCISLEEIHMSIGSLVKLDSLYLYGCERLKSLPDTICNLRALKVLNISRCSSLKALPTKLGNIESLIKLSAGSLAVSVLPDSIGHLTKLVELDLSNNNKLKTLPDTICNLRLLEILNINRCSCLKALPLEIGNIESLKEIIVRELTVSELPDSIGSLTKLVELDLRHNTELESLPDTICNLRSLEILSIKRCEKLVILPDQLWKITRLRELDARYTTLIKKLPDIGPSEIALSLQELKLSCSGITSLPSGLSQLSNLQSLDLENCEHLFFIPELPCNLKHINAFGCKSLERLLNLSNLKHLETLDLTLLGGLEENLCLELGWTEVQVLENFPFLRDLNRSSLTIQGLEKLTSIRRLRLGGCRTSHLTKRLFQIYSEFGHRIAISFYSPEILNRRSGPQWPEWSYWITESPYWISGSSESESIVNVHLLQNKLTSHSSLLQNKWTSQASNTELHAHLLPNELQNFMGIIICFQSDPEDYNNLSKSFSYSVRNTQSGFVWSDCYDVPRFSESLLMVIVPKSIFLITDDDHRIEVAANHVKIVGIHLLYKTETKMIEDVCKNTCD